jgi:hypothetical protein
MLQNSDTHTERNKPLSHMIHKNWHDMDNRNKSQNYKSSKKNGENVHNLG